MVAQDLDERIAELQTLRREKLLEEWEVLWKRKPPKNISQSAILGARLSLSYLSSFRGPAQGAVDPQHRL